MLNNLIKIAFLIVAICATYLLFGIYNKMEDSNATVKIYSPATTLLFYNKKTKQSYYYSGSIGYYKIGENGTITHLNKLPF